MCTKLCNFVVSADHCIWSSLKTVLKRIHRCKKDSSLLLFSWRSGGGGVVKICLFLKVQNTRKMSSFVNRLYRKLFNHKAEEIRRAMYL